MFFGRIAIPFLLLSCIPLVVGYSYDATPLETGNLIIFCVFSLKFLAEIALCFVSLAIARGFRTPLAVLLPAIVLLFLSCLNAIANDVADANADAFPPSQLIVSTNSMLEFFPDWGNTLLFIALCLAFFNRQAALNRHSAGRSAPVNVFQKFGLAFLSLLLFILATASGALLTVYLNATFDGRFARSVKDLNHKLNAYKNMSYAFESFLIASAFFVVFCAVVLLKAMKRAAVSDPASKALIYGATPLYVVYMIVTTAFVIINSPAGLKPSASLVSVESSQDAFAVLNNFFFFVIALLLIIVGFKRSSYAIGNTSDMAPPQAQVPMQTWPQSGYYPYPQPQPQQQGYYYAQYPESLKSPGESITSAAPPTHFKQ